jgi:hypothetical protein
VRFARSERLRLLRAARGAGVTSAERMRLKRFVRCQIRKILSPFLNYRPLNISKRLMAAQFRDSQLLEGFLPSRKAKWRPVMQRHDLGLVPEVDLERFSFVHNPIETVEKIRSILEIEATELGARLNFLDERCNDIGAFLVLQAIRQNMAPVFHGGRMNLAMQRVIDAVGLRAPLQMAPFRVNEHADTNIWPFHLRQRRRAGSSTSTDRFNEPQTKEFVADRFVEAVNSWLALVAKQSLSGQGRRLVLKLVGEALDNAERHSRLNSNDGDWAITGYLAKEPSQNGGAVFKVYVAFLSVGVSIAESVSAAPPSTRQKMNTYVNRHAGRRLGSDELRTVFALQDGVTQNHAAAADHRGGTGFQDIMEFFADLADAKSLTHEAKLTIVSGSACVNLSAPYMKGVRRGGEHSERELWFNPQNDPMFSPDATHVFGLPARLNGTLVSMVVALNAEYLEASANGQS